MMNKSTVLSSVFLMIVLSPLSVFAQTDTQYPAANFEPTVIYTANATSSNAKASETQTAAVTQKAEIDPQHPAAFFEPKVIYP